MSVAAIHRQASSGSTLRTAASRDAVCTPGAEAMYRERLAPTTDTATEATSRLIVIGARSPRPDDRGSTRASKALWCSNDCAFEEPTCGFVAFGFAWR